MDAHTFWLGLLQQALGAILSVLVPVLVAYAARAVRAWGDRQRLGKARDLTRSIVRALFQTLTRDDRVTVGKDLVLAALKKECPWLDAAIAGSLIEEAVGEAKRDLEAPVPTTPATPVAAAAPAPPSGVSYPNP